MSTLNWPLIKQTCGKLLLLESFFMALASLVSCYYHFTYGESDTLALIIPTLLCALLGGLLLIGRKQISQRVTQREGYFIVSVMWILFSVLGMLPFYRQCQLLAVLYGAAWRLPSVLAE